MAKQKSKAKPKTDDRKIFAILAYLSILCIIPLLFKKDDPFVLHHGKQGLVLFVGEVAVFVLHLLLGVWLLKLGMFVFGVLSFTGLIAALKGDYLELPFVQGIARKITL